MSGSLFRSVAFHQFGIVLGGIFFTALITQVVDSFVDVIQTRVLAIAADEKRAASSEDIVSLATTVCVKNVVVMLFAGGLCLFLEVHAWTRLLSPLVLIALFGRNAYLFVDAVACFVTRSRLPRGLSKGVFPTSDVGP